MRYPAGHKEAVKKKIVEKASQALRRSGLEGVSIPKLMKEVGLTHGGFYAHFKNRDELVSEAIGWAGAETANSVFSDELPLQETLSRYLSKSHLDHPECGCFLAALGSDGARQTPKIRRAFGDIASGFIRLVEQKLHPKNRPKIISDEALVLAATMVGAVMLGRLIPDAEVVERLLSAVQVTTVA